MNQDFPRLMQEAARLTRNGDVTAATTLIQRALGATFAAAPQPGGDRPPAADATVIDQHMRELRPEDDAGRGLSESQATRASPMLRGTFECRSGRRDWRLFVPDRQRFATPALLVMLHGCTQDADDFAQGTAMNEHASRAGFAVLYPEQSRKANAQGCWNWFKRHHQQRGRGEAALLFAMTRSIAAEHGFDTDRLYVAGLSAGGAMACVLGAGYPEVFAAIGVHSGLPAGVAADLPSALAAMQGPQGPLAGAAMRMPGSSTGSSPAAASGASAATPSPIHLPPCIVFHGDADATVHHGNAASIFTASVAGARERLRGDWPAIVESRGMERGRAFTVRTQHAPDGSAMAQHWSLHGGGHAWSGGDPRGSHADALGPDASAAMLRFFAAHSLGRNPSIPDPDHGASR